MTRYWIGVASKDHVMRGVKEGFCQLCHGKKAPLSRMKSGDQLLYYSPKKEMRSKEPYQKIVACGMIINDEVYQVEMSLYFHPYRKDVQYRNSIREVPLSELNQYNEWKDVRSRLRYGHFEISEALFYHIYHLTIEKQ
ncbi:EVE domain-containing protein [Sporolactobacillus pectinivorans]|uniref:EVE domain-containing protein n=1 Tax=Sporolactobacillus pectinivorans TaxID=1591408 RepID=UPI000C26B2A6|nr:EVE domain-containing protein [Sporolactobacillus pectinivorans]